MAGWEFLTGYVESYIYTPLCMNLFLYFLSSRIFKHYP
jgi:hypothetical protein